jgi:hypothetical protein
MPAPLKSAMAKRAPFRLAFRKHAFAIVAPWKICSQSASVRSARSRSHPSNRVDLRLALLRSLPGSLAFLKLHDERFFPDKSIPERSVSSKLAASQSLFLTYPRGQGGLRERGSTEYGSVVNCGPQIYSDKISALTSCVR